MSPRKKRRRRHERLKPWTGIKEVSEEGNPGPGEFTERAEMERISDFQPKMEPRASEASGAP